MNATKTLLEKSIGPAGEPVVPKNMANSLYLAAKQQGLFVYVGLDCQGMENGNVCPTCWQGGFVPMDKDSLFAAVSEVWPDLAIWGYERIEICQTPDGVGREHAVLVRPSDRNDG